MSLEQRLEDVEFLEKVAVNSIEDTVLYIKAYCKSKEQFGMSDQHYDNAKDFLRKYNKAKLYGSTPDFMQDLMTNMLLSQTGRIARKSVPYFVLMSVGAGLIYLGYKAGNSTVMMAGAGISLGAFLVTSCLMPKIEYQRTMIIYQAMAKHPEVVDKALKRLYQKEKNV